MYNALYIAFHRQLLGGGFPLFSVLSNTHPLDPHIFLIPSTHITSGLPSVVSHSPGYYSSPYLSYISAI